MTGSADPSAWAIAMDMLAQAGDRFAAEMVSRGNPVDAADIHATLLGALSDSYLNQLGVGADCPSFVPCTGYFQRLGSPNPDTVYHRAPIDPAGTYRLTGYRGEAADVTLMPFSSTMQSFTPLDLSDFASADDGGFDVILSAARPEGHVGDWWQLDPEWASLWLRETSDNWGREEPARIAIMRLDGGSRKRQSPESSARQLAGLVKRVEGIVEYGIRRVDELSLEGYVNKLKLVDYGAAGGMPGQWYHEGRFDLGEDQCLLIEAEMPADCHYFSWSLTDCMLVTLDWMNAHTSLNRRQAVIDNDGILRVVLSARDPGNPNWLETMGYGSGVLQCRSIGSTEPPNIAARILPIDSIFDGLPDNTPRITPEQRFEALRQRQSGSQLRRLW